MPRSTLDIVPIHPRRSKSGSLVRASSATRTVWVRFPPRVSCAKTVRDMPAQPIPEEKSKVSPFSPTKLMDTAATSRGGGGGDSGPWRVECYDVMVVAAFEGIG